MKEISVRIPNEWQPSDMPVARAMYMGEGYDWGGMMLYLDRVHELGIDGKGINIGIIDTGMHFGHPDLDDDCMYKDFTKDNNAKDLSGHGTHVRGIIGMKPNGKGLIGVAPGAKIHIAKSLAGRAGIGSARNLADAMRWMIEEVKPDWINLSLALTEPIKEIADLIDQGHKAGIGFVAASGNYSDSKVSFPASHPKVMAVGAIDMNDRLAYFSNKGEHIRQLSCVAPGVAIKSTWIDNQYRNSDGTSMATPFVTGLCALIQQRLRQIGGHPSDCDAVRLLVEGFAKDLGELGRDKTFGAGRITTDWFGVDTVADDVAKCRDLPCISDLKYNSGCLSFFLPKWSD